MIANSDECCCMIVIFKCFDIAFFLDLKMSNGGEHGVFEAEEEHPGAVGSELEEAEPEE